MTEHLTPFQAKCWELLLESTDMTRSLLERETSKRALTQLLRTGKLEVADEPVPFDARMAAAGDRGTEP